MPLGISESALRRAYGPLDLSGIYSSIDYISKQAALEKKLAKQAQQKEYYTSLASLNKDISGTRAVDNPEIMQNYNKFKSAYQQLIANPNLINRNPELYGQLMSEANTGYENAIELSQKSKAKKEYHRKLAAQAIANPNKFKEDALQAMSKFEQITSKDLDEQGIDDMDKLIYQGPDFVKVSKELQDVSKIKGIIAKVPIARDDKYGASIFSNYEIPNVGAIQSNIINFLSTKTKRDKDAILERLGPQFEVVRNEYNNLRDSELETFKTETGEDLFPVHTSPFTGQQTRKIDLNFDDPTTDGRINAFLLAKNILPIKTAAPIKGQQYMTVFDKGEVGKRQMINDLALKLQTTMEGFRQINRAALLETGLKKKMEYGYLDPTSLLQLRTLGGLIGKKAWQDAEYGDIKLDEEQLKLIQEELQKITQKVMGTKPKTPTPAAKKTIKGF